MKFFLVIMTMDLLECSLVNAGVNEIENWYISSSKIEQIKNKLKQYVDDAKNKQLILYVGVRELINISTRWEIF